MSELNHDYGEIKKLIFDSYKVSQGQPDFQTDFLTLLFSQNNGLGEQFMLAFGNDTFERELHGELRQFVLSSYHPRKSESAIRNEITRLYEDSLVKACQKATDCDSSYLLEEIGWFMATQDHFYVHVKNRRPHARECEGYSIYGRKASQFVHFGFLDLDPGASKIDIIASQAARTIIGNVIAVSEMSPAEVIFNSFDEKAGSLKNMIRLIKIHSEAYPEHSERTRDFQHVAKKSLAKIINVQEEKDGIT